MQKPICRWNHNLQICFLICTTQQKYVLFYIEFKKFWNTPCNVLFEFLFKIFLKQPLALVNKLIAYLQQDVSLMYLHTMKYCIIVLTEFMNAYTADYRTYGFSETLKKLNCLNLTKQQEREYKAQQKSFHIPFDTSMFAETEKKFFRIFNFEQTKLNQKPIEQLTQLLLQYEHCFQIWCRKIQTWSKLTPKSNSSIQKSTNQSYTPTITRTSTAIRHFKHNYKNRYGN